MAASSENETSNKQGLHYFLVCTSCILGLIIIRNAPFAEHLERYWSRKVEFGFRNLIQKEPSLDERVKIFTIKEANLSQGLPNKVALSTIQAIIAQKPRMIFVDNRLLESGNSNEEFKQLNRGKATVLITNGILAEDAGQDLGLTPVDRDKVLDGPKIEGFRGASLRHDRLYGPTSVWQRVFDRIGYAAYLDYGYFEPIHRVGADTFAMHAGLLGGEHTVFYRDALEIDGGIVQLTHDYLVPLDPPDRRALSERTRPLSIILNAANQANPMHQLIRDGDAVILAIQRPVASAFLPVAMTEDEAIVSIVNSQLKKTWLRETPLPWFMLLLAGLFGAIVASSTAGARQFLGILSTGMVWPLLGLIVFAYSGVSLPWLFAMTATWTSGAAIAYMQIRDRTRYRLQLHQAVSGKISPAAAAIFCERTSSVGAAQPRLCTFLSIESKILPLVEGAEVQKSIVDLGHQIRESIRNLLWAHGGVLHSNQDDQYNVMFGATIDGESNSEDHAQAALDAAIAVQKHLVDVTQNSANFAVYATIGAESGVGVVGVLDTARPLDFGIASDASRIAGQLRSSCHRYKIMLGPKFTHIIPATSLAQYSQQIRLTKLETTADASECRELTPFATPAELAQLRTSDMRCKQAIPYVRQDLRWPSVPADAILCLVDNSVGHLVNYSGSGVLIRLDRAFAKSTTLRLQLNSVDGALERSLSEIDIININAQVRWSQEDADKTYLHGLWFGDQLNPGQRERLVSIITNFLHTYARQKNKGA